MKNERFIVQHIAYDRLTRGMPRVHREPDERQVLPMNQIGQHDAHLIPFCPAAAVGIVDGAVDDPALLRQRTAVMKSQVQGMQCKAGSGGRPDDSLVASDTRWC
ncbi:hypothetical protein [Paraburkholderia domus]|uniref:hypothetical protein n=1 Tax=Paraburkholderia domus TaxID=2793075 RepID=UPI0019143D59|nr:hypothetical protein [Paraburkholderia domus]MBK5053085.1 hypothetical protein [Burkholderia sp. R-70006]MBK5090298.1 hypothetical protein [Burkholderia sp. R-69927]MBK5124713.1 hypothetical protein [Burkholderia sp. R-69980]MBK5168963.1 hypothetical protein [Burkholderia sp. R-70211]MBK5184168.1 hypothetical protein [Burkholderia sp. R-69749]MCI0150641.1 hypothetical protein [Paraburkholderia sediminicola]